MNNIKFVLILFTLIISGKIFAEPEIFSDCSWWENVKSYNYAEDCGYLEDRDRVEVLLELIRHSSEIRSGMYSDSSNHYLNEVFNFFLVYLNEFERSSARLSELKCSFTELGIGQSVELAGQAQIMGECRRRITQNLAIEFVEPLYYEYSKYIDFVKPSFDCAKSQTHVEKNICIFNDLAELDLNISETYNNKKIDNGFRSNHIIWIKTERNSCEDEIDYEVHSCLKSKMEDYLAKL
jgi:hypothetical protein